MEVNDMKPPDRFTLALKETRKHLNSASRSLSLVEALNAEKRREEAMEAAFSLAGQTERLLLMARALPSYTGAPLAPEHIRTQTAQAVPIHMGFTSRRWFVLDMPMLLPKKKRGSEYIPSLLYPAFREFFRGKPPLRYTDSVMIFRHIYGDSRQRCRDHDNIEIGRASCRERV